MKYFQQVLITLLLPVGLILPNLAAGASSKSVPAEAVSQTTASYGASRYVRVPGEFARGLASLGLEPLHAYDYGSFRWLELTQADYIRLQASHVPYLEDSSAGEVNVPGYRFDPLAGGEPDVAASLRSIEGETGFRLVQFHGPLIDEWLADVAATGAQVLQYYPHNTYLLWATPEQASRSAALPSVRWVGSFHPAYKINADLAGRSGLVLNVAVFFYNDGDLARTLSAISSLGGSLLDSYPAQPDKTFYEAIFALDSSSFDNVAQLNTVLWLGYAHPEPVLDDEMSSQILAGNYTSGVPFTGYQAWLTSVGVNGSGVTWAVIDTGVDYDHPDLGPHIVGGYNFPGACSYTGEPGSDCPGGGHGTHVAGIVGGDASGGFADPDGFLYGLGVAPAYGIYAMNSLSAPAWPPTGGWQEHSKRAVIGGAIGGNNSWTTGEGTAHGYQSSERTHDLMVRDGNFDTAASAEPFIEVFSAGNSGPSASSLTAPKEAKNLIVTASSRNYRAGNIDAISSFSSRGPAVDGRYVPTIAAPGETIASARNDDGGSCSNAIPSTNSLYAFCSGTSMAAPHTSGAITLITEWWRGFNGGSDPSPAMAKALLVNGAVDMGSADIPNFNEGWGRIHLPNLIDNGTYMVYEDQGHLFQNTGESRVLSVGVLDPAKPLKVTLAWSDAPGGVGADPALVNNLDLSVQNGGNTYLGNWFSAGWSVTGGSPDTINNLENVYIQSPGSSATITVQATNIAGDGLPYNGDLTDQDYALVCYNCTLGTDFLLDASPLSQAVCAPDEAGYTVDVTPVMGFSTPVSLSTAITPTSALTTTFSVNPVTPAGSTVLTVGNTASTGAASYDIAITGQALTLTHVVSVTLDVYPALAGAPVLVSPADGASGQPLQPTLVWESAVLPSTYDLQVARDLAFSDVVESAAGLTTSSYTLTVVLDTAAQYYWRVRTTDTCGTGAYSAPFSFNTYVAPADCPVGRVPVQLYQQGFESGDGGWMHSGTQDTWGLSDVRTSSGTWSMHALDPGSVSDQMLTSPPVSLPDGIAPLTLQFWNYQWIEDATTGCYDGGLLEISQDGGATWAQIESDLLTDPYDGAIRTGTGNPLAGLNAWCGDPQDWLNSVVALDGFAGETVQFRFRLGSDNAIGREGWYVDDVLVQACVLDGYAAAWSAPSELDGQPGEVVIHTFSLQNLGLSETYTITLAGNAWETEIISGTQVKLLAGSSAEIVVQVRVPDNPLEVVLPSDSFTLTATPQTQPAVSFDVLGTTNAVASPPGYGIFLPVIER